MGLKGGAFPVQGEKRRTRVEKVAIIVFARQRRRIARVTRRRLGSRRDDRDESTRSIKIYKNSLRVGSLAIARRRFSRPGCLDSPPAASSRPCEREKISKGEQKDRERNELENV